MCECSSICFRMQKKLLPVPSPSYICIQITLSLSSPPYMHTQSYILYSEAVNLKLFPSVWQRPLFSEPNLRASGWWDPKDTGYQHDINRVKKTVKAMKE